MCFPDTSKKLEVFQFLKSTEAGTCFLVELLGNDRTLDRDSEEMLGK